jgi:hypothetical protein
MIIGLRKWSCILLIAILSLSYSELIFAQDESTSTTQLWLFWHHNHYFNPRLKYLGDIGSRQETPYDNWVRIHFRPGVQWSAGS